MIERRYWQGIERLFSNYLPLVDKAYTFDNSSGKPVLIAEKLTANLDIRRNDLYHSLLTQYEAGKTA